MGGRIIVSCCRCDQRSNPPPQSPRFRYPSLNTAQNEAWFKSARFSVAGAGSRSRTPPALLLLLLLHGSRVPDVNSTQAVTACNSVTLN